MRHNGSFATRESFGFDTREDDAEKCRPFSGDIMFCFPDLKRLSFQQDDEKPAFLPQTGKQTTECRQC